MLKDCEADPAAKEDASMEKIAKAKHILDELNSAINETKTETFAQKMKVENEFNVGMEKNLIPWIDDMERESLKQLEKPDNFEHAREIEKQSVVFAKEVRKANKLLQTLETSIEKLPDKKMWAGQQLGEQKVRFKNIATVAATRAETMRDLLVNWNFFMETKGEVVIRLMVQKCCTHKEQLCTNSTLSIKDNVRIFLNILSKINLESNKFYCWNFQIVIVSQN